MDFESHYYNKRWSRIVAAGRPELNERARAAFVPYFAAFSAFVDAEHALERTHVMPQAMLDDTRRLRALRYPELASEQETSWRAGEPARRQAVVEALRTARVTLDRARARFEAERTGYQPETRWYVSAISADGMRYAILLGPYESPESAADAVPVGCSLARDLYSIETAFASFGICAGHPSVLGQGKLNSFV